MYYRYTSRKKGRGLIKVLIIGVSLLAVLFLAYTFRHDLQFWKYTANKIVKRLNAAVNIKDRNKRTAELNDLEEVISHYKMDNMTRPDVYFMSASVRYHLALSRLPGSFSEMVINGQLGKINDAVFRILLEVIKDIRKGDALGDGAPMDVRNSIMLGMSCLLTGYLDNAAILGIIDGPAVLSMARGVEDVRFLSIVFVLNEKYDRGIELLKERGHVDEGIEGTLFLATVEKMAKQFTISIENFRRAMSLTEDNRIKKLIFISLGTIFYNQSLYKESLDSFMKAHDIDEDDNSLKIWIGRNYFALGDRNRARAIWSDVLAADRHNSEAKKLLGIM